MTDHRPHTAVSLACADRLPLTGELHPLRREFEKWLATSHALTLLAALSIFAAWYFVQGRLADPSTPVSEVRVTIEPGPTSPPPIVPREPSHHSGATTTRMHNEPPVPVARETEPPSEDAGSGEPGDVPSGGSDDTSAWLDTLVTDSAPDETEWAVFDELPMLISIDQPVYPRIVREAGIEGTVDVRVRVGRNGRVKEAVVVESGPLEAAALDCARSAVFRPALQGHHPVEVWIVVPITFQLENRR